MASNDPGFAMMPTAEDPKQGGIAGSEENPEGERPVAPDQFDPKYETTRTEIWAYYAYYIGNNGLTLFNFAPTQFQNLLSQAAGDSGTLVFAGRERTINSIVLLSNGISFAIQVVVFLIIGSYAGTVLNIPHTTAMFLTFPRFRQLATQHPHRAFNPRLCGRLRLVCTIVSLPLNPST